MCRTFLTSLRSTASNIQSSVRQTSCTSNPPQTNASSNYSVGVHPVSFAFMWLFVILPQRSVLFFTDVIIHLVDQRQKLHVYCAATIIIASSKFNSRIYNFDKMAEQIDWDKVIQHINQYVSLSSHMTFFFFSLSYCRTWHECSQLFTLFQSRLAWLECRSIQRAGPSGDHLLLEWVNVPDNYALFEIWWRPLTDKKIGKTEKKRKLKYGRVWSWESWSWEA